MRPDQVFNQKQGPHTITVSVSAAEVFDGAPEETQGIVAVAMSKVIMATVEQLKKQGVYVEFKQV